LTKNVGYTLKKCWRKNVYNSVVAIAEDTVHKQWEKTKAQCWGVPEKFGILP
jgi:hypothetical protein